MSTLSVAVAAVVGLPIGSMCNRLILREPGYVIRDPGDLADDADPALLDELEPEPAVGDVPVFAIVRPGAWTPRWLPVTEAVTAGGFALTVHRLGGGVVGVVVLFLVAALVALGGVDARVFRLPDRLNGPAIAVALPLIVAASVYLGVPGAILGAVTGALVYFGLLLVMHVVSPRGMGFGDVKLAFLMGLYLGWVGWQDGPFGAMVLDVAGFVLIAAMAGSVLGLVAGVVYGVARRSFRAVFPFGPALAVGCLAVVLWSAELR